MVSIPYTQIPTNSLYTWLFHTCHLFNDHISHHAQCCIWLGKAHRVTPKSPWHVQGQEYPYAYYIYFWRPNFYLFTLQWSVFELQSNLGKGAPHDPNITLTCSRSKVSICILSRSIIPYAYNVLHTRPRPKFFVHFALQRAVLLNYAPFSEKCTKWNWYVQGQKYQYAWYIWYIDLRGSNLQPFHSTMSSFWVTIQLWEKCTEWPRNDLDMFKIKSTYMHTIPHTWGPNFHQFPFTMSRFWAMAQFWEKTTEWPQITLTCSRSKVPICLLHTSLTPKFLSVSLYDDPFQWNEDF